jgi:hypothetical protein
MEFGNDWWMTGEIGIYVIPKAFVPAAAVLRHESAAAAKADHSRASMGEPTTR